MRRNALLRAPTCRATDYYLNKILCIKSPNITRVPTRGRVKSIPDVPAMPMVLDYNLRIGLNAAATPRLEPAGRFDVAEGVAVVVVLLVAHGHGHGVRYADGVGDELLALDIYLALAAVAVAVAVAMAVAATAAAAPAGARGLGAPRRPG